MYILTKELDNIESGTFATIDNDGRAIIQFFVNKDDAVTYNTLLEALGQDLAVTETEDEAVDKICNVMGYAYSVVEPGELVIPRIETLQHEFL